MTIESNGSLHWFGFTTVSVLPRVKLSYSRGILGWKLTLLDGDVDWVAS